MFKQRQLEEQSDLKIYIKETISKIEKIFLGENSGKLV